MASDKKVRKQATKGLKAAQQQHSKMLAKVEKTRQKLEKRTRKLQALEAHIADLQGRQENPEAEKLGQAETPGVNLRHARLIYNYKSKEASDQLEQIVRQLRAHGIVAEIELKTSGKAARKLAREAVDDGEDLIIVAAGDGTIEDVAGQLVGSKTSLGIVPVGTMNNIARSLGIPLDVDDACELLAMSTTRKIDIGRVLADEAPKTEFFVETAGMGLSAIAIPAGQAMEKGRWNAIPNAIHKLFDTKPAEITVQLDDGEQVRANAQVVTVSNAPMMGRNIMVAPDAKMDDGLLDIAVYDGMNKAELLAYFMSAMDGKRANNEKVKFYRSRRVRILTNKPVEAHSDKDVVPASGVLEIECVPGALSAVVGKGIALTIPVEAAPSVPPLSGDQKKDQSQES